MGIHQEVTINAAPKTVFDILMSAEKFAAMTGGREAEISPEVGGALSLFGGAISAINVEVEAGKRVVQAWRSNDWPEGIHSIVRFELSAEGGNTKIVFDQAGHPEDATEMLTGGWQQMYWEPMNAMLSAG